MEITGSGIKNERRTSLKNVAEHILSTEKTSLFKVP